MASGASSPSSSSRQVDVTSGRPYPMNDSRAAERRATDARRMTWSSRQPARPRTSVAHLTGVFPARRLAPTLPLCPVRGVPSGRPSRDSSPVPTARRLRSPADAAQAWRDLAGNRVRVARGRNTTDRALSGGRMRPGYGGGATRARRGWLVDMSGQLPCPAHHGPAVQSPVTQCSLGSRQDCEGSWVVGPLPGVS